MNATPIVSSSNPEIKSSSSTTPLPPSARQALFCPCCGVALRVERQPNYRRVDGKLVEIDPLWLATCDNPDCPFFGYTVVDTTFDDPAERRRYGIEYAPYDVRTGRYKPAWERFSNCGPDIFLSRWEKRSYQLHAGKAG